MNKKEMKLMWAGQNKQVARSIALNKKYHRHGNAVVLLPGCNCYDLIEGINRGVFSPSKDRFILVEHKLVEMEIIKATVASLGCKDVYFHFGKLEKLDLIEAAGNKKIDYMYLDTCSNLNPDIAFWLANLPTSVFRDSATIIPSFCSQRGSKPWFDKNFGGLNFLPGLSVDQVISARAKRETPIYGYTFIYDGELIEGSAAWKKLWASNCSSQGQKTEQYLADHANALSLLLGMNYKHEYEYGYMYHDNKARMFTTIFHLKGKKRVGVKIAEYIMSLLTDVPKAKIRQIIKTRKHIVAGQKAVAKKLLDKKLSKDGLSKMQKAGYLAAYTKTINSIVEVGM